MVFNIVQEVDSLLRGLTGFKGEYKIMDSDLNLYNLDGEFLGKSTDDELNKMISRRPKRSCCTDEHDIIYLSDYKFKNRKLGLDSLLIITEEVFHAQDSNANSSFHIAESLAFLARYLTGRWLANKLNLDLKNENQTYLLNKFIGPSLRKKNKKGFELYYTSIFKGLEHARIDSFVSVSELLKYYGRLCLIGYVKQLDELSYDEAFKEIKNFYESIKSHKSPVRFIEKKGFEFKTIPDYLKLIKRLSKDGFTSHFLIAKYGLGDSLLYRLLRKEDKTKTLFDRLHERYKELLNSNDQSKKVKLEKEINLALLKLITKFNDLRYNLLKKPLNRIKEQYLLSIIKTKSKFLKQLFTDLYRLKDELIMFNLTNNELKELKRISEWEANSEYINKVNDYLEKLIG